MAMQGDGSQPIPATAPWTSKISAEAATLLVLIAIAAGAIVLSRSFEPDPRMFPLYISIVLIVLSLFRLAYLFRAAGRDAKADVEVVEVPEEAPPSLRDETASLAAIISIVPMIYLSGLSLATFLFTAAFVRFSGRRTFLGSLTIGAVTGICVWWGSLYLLKSASPHGLIFEWAAAWFG